MVHWQRRDARPATLCRSAANASEGDAADGDALKARSKLATKLWQAALLRKPAGGPPTATRPRRPPASPAPAQPATGIAPQGREAGLGGTD